MRIIGGIYKNRVLEFKRNKEIRPTRQIVKKSFFDSISYMIEGSVFVDLFAGNGVMGIEALSRGAQKAYFVDRQDAFIKKNLQKLGVSDEKFKIYRMNVFEFLNLDILEDSDIIYIDAPYVMDVSELLVFLLKKLKKDAIVCLESNRMIEHERVFKIKKFGNSILNYLR